MREENYHDIVFTKEMLKERHDYHIKYLALMDDPKAVSPAGTYILETDEAGKYINDRLIDQADMVKNNKADMTLDGNKETRVVIKLGPMNPRGAN